MGRSQVCPGGAAVLPEIWSSSYTFGELHSCPLPEMHAWRQLPEKWQLRVFAHMHLTSCTTNGIEYSHVEMLLNVALLICLVSLTGPSTFGRAFFFRKSQACYLQTDSPQKLD